MKQTQVEKELPAAKHCSDVQLVCSQCGNATHLGTDGWQKPGKEVDKIQEMSNRWHEEEPTGINTFLHSF